MSATRFRLGLRVEDVPAAAGFYRGLGFEELGSVPGPNGRPVLTMLQRDGVHLIVDALDETYDYCVRVGCTITCEPMDEAWGDRVFECIDPFGYQWELSHPIAAAQPADGLAAVRAAWFGDAGTE